jgi:hypothetical protein
MKSNIFTVTGLLVVFRLSAIAAEPSTVKLEKLPEGKAGLAAKYPGDKGVAQDPAVLFAEDFENCSSIVDIKKKWDNVVHESNLSIAEGASHELGGRKCLLMTIPKQNEPLATGMNKSLKKRQEILFLRWYMKFDDGWLVPGGSVHNGGTISSKYNVNGRATPGIRADGRNKFLVNFENENATGNSPGQINFYVYWPEQFDIWGDHFYPSGMVVPGSYTRSGAATFGKQFKSRPDFTPELGRWYCYEFMVKANTPGQRDGRIAMWVDGKLIGDFPNMRLRDVKDLEIDEFGIGLYIANNAGRKNRKWHDNVVAATSYIGPVAASK